MCVSRKAKVNGVLKTLSWPPVGLSGVFFFKNNAPKGHGYPPLYVCSVEVIFVSKCMRMFLTPCTKGCMARVCSLRMCAGACVCKFYMCISGTLFLRLLFVFFILLGKKIYTFCLPTNPLSSRVSDYFFFLVHFIQIKSFYFINYD